MQRSSIQALQKLERLLTSVKQSARLKLIVFGSSTATQLANARARREDVKQLLLQGQGLIRILWQVMLQLVAITVGMNSKHRQQNRHLSLYPIPPLHPKRKWSIYRAIGKVQRQIAQ